MQDEIKVSEGYQPTHQFISFVEGSSAQAPDISAYPLQVLEADHNLNHLDGGDPTDGFSPWVTDILVYPSSEYWEGKLNSGRVRPYVDLSISNYNTLRIPSAVHDYDLYVDNAIVYENLTIFGATNLEGELKVTGKISPQEIEINSGAFSVSPSGSIKGVSNTKAPIQNISTHISPSNDDSGTIFQCKGNDANTNVTLPVNGEDGVVFTFMNCDAGKTVTFNNLTRARGVVLSEQYSAATIYWADGAWYGFGDLV